MPNFQVQLQDIKSDITEFVQERDLKIGDLLTQAQALINELRAAGLVVTVRYPIGVKEPLQNIEILTEVTIKV